MQPSTYTRVCLPQLGSGLLRDNCDAVRLLHRAGFRSLDMNLHYGIFQHDNYILRHDDWEKKIAAVAETAAELGVTFDQGHLPFIKACCTDLDPKFREPGYAAFYDRCMERAYLACEMLGIKYVTAHPITFAKRNCEDRYQQERNREYYDRFVEFGIKHGVGTAFENMTPYLKQQLPYKYCQSYEQLIELVDSYHDDMVAICWDTGHANFMKIDQGIALRAIGRRLKSVHINDNKAEATRDEHLLPYMGDIDWTAVIDALAEIGYEGNMTLESPIGELTPEPLMETYLRLQYDCAAFLVGEFEAARSRLEARG